MTKFNETFSRIGCMLILIMFYIIFNIPMVMLNINNAIGTMEGDNVNIIEQEQKYKFFINLVLGIPFIIIFISLIFILITNKNQNIYI